MRKALRPEGNTYNIAGALPAREQEEATMPSTDLALVAHLMRRAGFGATRPELEGYATQSYEGIVEDLLHPERFPEVADDVVVRYWMELNNPDSVEPWNTRWMYRMVNTARPLEEKMALFWHHVFATSVGKSEHGPSSKAQIDLFRRNAVSDMRTILVDLARDPAMIHWLDNCENYGDRPNENWGRELLELFSMGVGKYTEQDIKMASRAFTGWTFIQPIPLDPYGRYPSEFVYREDDHDDSEKTFLGHVGRLTGEDIIDIVAKQPATARFISRHLYNFFVADEPQVPSWHEVPPREPEAIDALCSAYFDSDGSVREMLRVLFSSDFFKDARFTKVKSPAELAAGTIKLAGTHRFPDPALHDAPTATGLMGQHLMTPPTVEGWHTGREWIDCGTLAERVNFAVNEVADPTLPGIGAIADRLAAEAGPLAPDQFVDRTLDLVGPMIVESQTREALLDYANSGGDLRFDTDAEREESSARVARMVQFIVASVEYQFC